MPNGLASAAGPDAGADDNLQERLLNPQSDIQRYEWRQVPRPVANGHMVIAIGDVHGRADLLTALLEAVAEDVARLKPEQVTAIMLGDLIDRGPSSLEVLGLAMGGLGAFTKRPVKDVCLVGNHDYWLRQAVDGSLEDEDLRFWGANGGEATWRSFGITRVVGARDMIMQTRRRLPDPVLDFVMSMSVTYRVDDYLFVHAGIDPRQPLNNQTLKTLCWIRDPFLNPEVWPFELTVVHGHTVEWNHGEPLVHGHRIGIDTGAVNTGVLTALEINSGQMRFVQAWDERALEEERRRHHG
ncbi:metallophosphoesterase [Nisaea sediminum]|uniref:metallophosphoesterase n=1 Tax=Nisaea sediminum TaxID=2775867 RepID=UPI001D015447|nr:metallophosphoesterase [Nisaea sediminum]